MQQDYEEIRVGHTTIHACTYEASLLRPGDHDLNVVLNPSLEYPYSASHQSQILDLLKRAEKAFSELSERTPAHVLESEATAYLDLARAYSEDDPDATVADLMRGWDLYDLIFFSNGFRLIFSGDTYFQTLDLLMEFDYSWNLQAVQFDG